MDLGGVLATTPGNALSGGSVAGQGSSNAYGARGMNTYDPRDVILEGRVTF
jgi:hypothetical protein